MRIDSNIAAFYQSGLLSPQVDVRTQQEQARRQPVATDAVQGTAKSAKADDALNAGEYERVRSRLEREQDGRVVPEGMDRRARNAVSAYGNIAGAEERSYNSRVLGIDTYA
ncbi:MAG: hypothetical protein H7842_03805 [Gammaproteobacteria bacterium SHHR-1]|uniref:hypothetical protein n=1 Tax=Magnetovirga frankeli TaxID=947516 RepID=UPI001292CDFE|nr:hypothetical protein D5125_01280 [gamma proteobacterium SS-5]